MRKKVFILFLFIPVIFLKAQIPDGYYQRAGELSGTALQQLLHDIIDNHTIISYDSLWEAFLLTDVDSQGYVWDIYSDLPGGTSPYSFTFVADQCGNYSEEGDCYNREHSFPKSWFNSLPPMVCDLFHIYPTDGYVNGKRANYPYGETDNPTWVSLNGSKLGPCSSSGYTLVVFEPIDEYKGDIARSYFYMATRYYGEDMGWEGSDMVDGAQPKAWALAMLLQWNDDDPVSQKEIDRNNAIYNYQHNRNPFIDHPEYADSIWESSSSDVVANEPTNHVADFSAAFVRLTWNDATGENLPSGYLVLISENSYDDIPTPTDGVEPSGYSNAKVVAYGVQNCTFSNLKHDTSYYFKIYSYCGSGKNVDYKTDGNVQKTMVKTK